MRQKNSIFNQLSDLLNPRHFYNTTGETDPVHETKAKTQDDRVMEYFKKHPTHFLSADMVWKEVFAFENVPLTSVRRAISTLERMELIEKTGEMTDGLYGKKTNTWRVKRSALIIEPTLF